MQLVIAAAVLAFVVPNCYKQEGKKALLFWVSSRRNKTGGPPVLGQQAAGSRAPQSRVAPQAPQN
jgi:hypothetical protein